MPGEDQLARAFEQHAQRRAAGKPTPSVLIGAEVAAAWVAALDGRAVVRCAGAGIEAVIGAYLGDVTVRGELVKVVHARVEQARLGRAAIAEKTPFERALWIDVSRDALLAAGDHDADVLLASVTGDKPPPPTIMMFPAAVRLLAERAAALWIDAPPALLDTALRTAIQLAEAMPSAHIAVATTRDAWSAWQEKPNREHAKAMVRSCVIELAEEAQPRAPAAPARSSALEEARRLSVEAKWSGTPKDDEAARSAAERALFEALEASAVTRGLFELNRCLDVSFGSRPLEIDLASTSLGLAIEVDGYFHFRDLDAYRRDRRKDVVLQREGYFVVRVLADDIAVRLEETLATIHETIAIARARVAKERAHEPERT